MEIPPSPEQVSRPGSSTSSAVNSIRPAELLAQVKPGQSLLAKVERLLTNNEVELRIGNQLVRAKSPIQLAAGQPIKLLVEDSNQGTILRIAQQVNQVETLARAWRAVLPKQQPVADVVRQLVQTLATSKADTSTTNNAAASSLRTAIQNLVNNLPSVKTLSHADGLRQAIQDSGVSLESQLRKAVVTGIAPRTDNNIKANFLRAAQSALQLQGNAVQNAASPAASSNQAGNVAGKAGPVNAYTALLTAASKQPPELEKATTTTRPLLPPLPVTPPLTDSSRITNRLIASLPPLLQRLIPLPLLNTVQHQANIASPLSQQAPASQQIFSTMIVELLNQMESGLARIQQHQLSSLAGDDVIRHFLNLELPVFNGKTFDNIGVRFEWDRESPDETDNQHQWRVVLNFDFDELGKTQVVIHANQDGISSDFKSETKIAQQIFQTNQQLLEKGLQQHGLTPGKFTFSTGEIETPQPNQHDENLVKTRV